MVNNSALHTRVQFSSGYDKFYGFCYSKDKAKFVLFDTYVYWSVGASLT